MNSIYLPTLKKINIKDFSLYPNALDFTYEFIDGVNLIVGGNGVGKTTFVNIIKFALIGLYKKNKDSRRYKENKIIKREQYSEDFFKNRMNPIYEENHNARVTITFEINDTVFEVTRNLFDITLEKVKITQINGKEYYLNGEIIKQHKYEKLDNQEKRIFLQYIYEEKVAKLANLFEFDDLIFFVNRVLFFGEDRKTILWDADLQEVLSSKYFNDPELDNKYSNLKMDAKYYDSLSRHRSEDIRAVRNVLEKIQKDSPTDKNINLVSEINILKQKSDKKLKQLESIQSERKLVDNKLKVILSDKNSKRKVQSELEIRIKNEEKLLYKELWEKLNPDYQNYLRYIKENKSCPLCNKELESSLYKQLLIKENQCFLCHKEINNPSSESSTIKKLKVELDNILISLQSIENNIFNTERKLESLDNEFNKVKIEFANIQTKLRDLEYAFSNKDPNNNKDSIAVEKMMSEMSKLELEKKDYQEKSKDCIDAANNIALIMDENRIKITRKLSFIFAEFAEKFLGMECELTYDEVDDKGKRYIPKINNSLRLFSEELSESQSFFVDHSFRMSLLSYFYTTPTFFICETPESSLDISYEMNAANIFLKFLNKPNILILTSNLNNSEFLDYIIENANRINYINLLKLGNPTLIQSNNNNLIEISNRIEEKINGKRRTQ